MNCRSEAIPITLKDSIFQSFNFSENFHARIFLQGHFDESFYRNQFSAELLSWDSMLCFSIIAVCWYRLIRKFHFPQYSSDNRRNVKMLLVIVAKIFCFLCLIEESLLGEVIVNGVEARNFIPYQASVRVSIRDYARFGRGEWSRKELALSRATIPLRPHLRRSSYITTNCDDSSSLLVRWHASAELIRPSSRTWLAQSTYPDSGYSDKTGRADNSSSRVPAGWEFCTWHRANHCKNHTNKKERFDWHFIHSLDRPFHSTTPCSTYR